MSGRNVTILICDTCREAGAFSNPEKLAEWNTVHAHNDDLEVDE